MISLLKILDQDNMFFKKRKPSHFIVYFLYKNEERRLYNFLSKITHSVIGSTNDVDDIINKIRVFVKKNEGLKLDQINLTSYGDGYSIVMGLTDEDVIRIIDELKPIIHSKTRIMTTTCFSGSTLRKLVELSEHYGGLEVYGLLGEYTLSSKMNKCKCKDKGYSQRVIHELPKSRWGFDYDAVKVVNTYRRDEGEKVDWKRGGMAYEYDKLMVKEGVCDLNQKQPHTLLRSIVNYLFNI